MATKTREHAQKLGTAASGKANFFQARMRTAPPVPTAEGAPPGVCENWDTGASAASQFSQTPEVRVFADPVCSSVEDLFVAAGLFDEKIANILAVRREAFGISTSPRRRLCDPDPTLKPIVVSRR